MELYCHEADITGKLRSRVLKLNKFHLYGVVPVLLRKRARVRLSRVGFGQPVP